MHSDRLQAEVALRQSSDKQLRSAVLQQAAQLAVSEAEVTGTDLAATELPLSCHLAAPVQATQHEAELQAYQCSAQVAFAREQQESSYAAAQQAAVVCWMSAGGSPLIGAAVGGPAGAPATEGKSVPCGSGN